MSDRPVFKSSLIDHTDLERYRNKAAREGNRLLRPEGVLPNSPGIQSVHVIMVPWCQCCAARVPLDHICACESQSETEGKP